MTQEAPKPVVIVPKRTEIGKEFDKVWEKTQRGSNRDPKDPNNKHVYDPDELYEKDNELF